MAAAAGASVLTLKFLLIGQSKRAREVITSIFEADAVLPCAFAFSSHQKSLSIADREMKVHLAAADVDKFEFFDKEEFLKGAQGAVFVYDAGDYGSFEAVVKVRGVSCCRQAAPLTKVQYMKTPGYARQVGMILSVKEPDEVSVVPMEEVKVLAQEHGYLYTTVGASDKVKLSKLMTKLSRALKDEHDLSLAKRLPKPEDLHRLVQRGDTALVQLCLYGDREPSPKNLVMKPDFRDAFERTPLHIAAGESNVEMCLLLMQAGCKLNAKDKEMRTPLHVAASRDAATVAELLLRAGASVGVREKRHLSYIGIAAREGSLGVLQLAVTLGHDLTEVKELDLSGKQLSELPAEFPWANLDSLRTLDLDGNNLDMLPGSIANLDLLERVQLEGNPLRFVPQQYRTPWPTLRDYIRSIGDKARNWTERKLLFVGQDGVGKTTLLKALQSKKLKVSCRENLSTDGIKVHSDVNIGDTTLHFNAWDLGGQQVYYPSHQFFLASNSVFIVVFNLADPNFRFLDDWMRQIYTVNNSVDAPVILVGTHLDTKNLTPEAAEDSLELVRKRYPRYRFRGVVQVLGVSNKTGKGMPALVEALRKIFSTVSQPELPEEWVHFYEYLKNTKEERGTEYVQFSQLAAWARKCGITASELPQCTKFLCDVGIILHFDDTNSKLNEIVILNPQFLADVMANILSFTHNWLKGGLLTPQLVPQVFYKYDTPMTERIIALLIRFHIIYKVKDSDNYLVPLLLPVECPRVEFADAWTSVLGAGLAEYGRTYDFKFVPHGFFSRILVRLFHQPALEHLVVWRIGAVLKLENHLGLIQYDAAECSIKITVRVPKSSTATGMLLRAMVESLEALIYCYYPRLKESTQRLLPCTHCMLANTRTPFMFSYSECIQAVTHGKPFVFCHHIMSPSRCVRIDQLAPDIAFTDLPRISNESISVGKLLGAGAFGTVHRGVYKGTPVALKELKFLIGDDNERVEKFNEFQQEAWIMSCLNHPHLVKLYGVTVYPLRMVMELVDGGDIFNFLHPRNPATGSRETLKPEQFPWPLRFKLALDIAVGMRYLQHGINPPIIHRDLRTPNVFIVSTDPKSPVCAKVADFGLARLVAPDIAGSLGTWQWLAPEVLDKGTRQYDERSDVYSFGIVLWELCTMQIPFLEYLEVEEYGMTCWDGKGREIRQFDAVLMKHEIIDKNLRPTIPLDLDVRLRVLIDRCLSANPSLRPSFVEIVRTLSFISGQTVADDLDESPSRKAVLGAKRHGADRKSKLILPEDCLLSNRLQQESLRSVVRIQQQLSVPVKVRCLLTVGNDMWVGLQDGTINVYDAHMALKTSFSGHSQRSSLHTMIKVAESVWMGFEDGFIVVWNGLTIVKEKAWPAHQNNIIKALLRVKVSDGTDRVWSASPSEKAIRVWNSHDFSHVALIQQQHSVYCMEQHRDAVWIGGSDKLFLFDANSNELTGHWRAHDSSVTSIVSSGARVWTGSAEGEVKIWEEGDTGLSQAGAHSVHYAKVLSICSDDTYMWTGSLDKSMIVWDAAGTEPVQEITDHRDAVWAVETFMGSVWTAADKTIIIYAHEARLRSGTEITVRTNRRKSHKALTGSLEIGRGILEAAMQGGSDQNAPLASMIARESSTPTRLLGVPRNASAAVGRSTSWKSSSTSPVPGRRVSPKGLAPEASPERSPSSPPATFRTATKERGETPSRLRCSIGIARAAYAKPTSD